MPRSTLKSWLAGKHDIGARPGRKPLLTAADETKLMDFASNCAAMGYGFRKRQFLKYAGALGKKHGHNFMNGVPLHKWWRLFNKCNGKLSLRQPKGTSIIRHRRMDPITVA